MRVLDWPASLKIAGAPPPDVRSRSASSGRGLQGTERVGPGVADAWIWEGSIRDQTPESAALIDGLVTRLQGRFGLIRMPIWRRAGLSIRERSGGAFTADVLFSGDETFSDGTGFAGEGLVALANQGASRGATRLVVSWPSGVAEARPGDPVGYGSDRASRVQEVEVLAGSLRALMIWPPLRSAVPAGAAVRLDEITVLMRSTQDDIAREAFGPSFNRTIAFSFEEAIASTLTANTTGGAMPYSQLIGGGPEIIVTHNLNTDNILEPTLTEVGTGVYVSAGYQRIDANNLRVTLGASVPANTYLILITAVS